MIANCFFIEDNEDQMSGNDNDGDGEDDNKQEYVKKEFVARPYDCTSGVLEEVEKSIVKNSRPLL